MAMKSSTAPSVGATAPATTPADPIVTEPVQPKNPVTAIPFAQIAARMMSSSALSEAGANYVKYLRDALTTKSNNVITVEDVTTRIETVACIHHAAKQAILIIFNENYMASTPLLPPTEFMPDICADFHRKYNDISVIQYITLIPEDYTRAAQMVNHVLNCFESLKEECRATAGSFAGMRLTPITDLNMVMNFVHKYSPHAVPARADWGVLLNQLTSPVRLAEYQNQKDAATIPQVAITGYTKFVQTFINGRTMMQPVCVITDVISTVPSVAMLMLALPVAAGCIIFQRHWEQPYTKFTKDSPNLGVLSMTDDKKALNHYDTLEQMRQHMPTVILDKIYLAMDCVEGRARIPGVENFLMQGSAALNEEIAKFFGPQALASILASNQQSILTSFFNYEGVYRAGGQLLDTRCGDYINMITELKDYNRCRRALSQSVTPNSHLNDIASVYGEDVVTALYRSHTLIFNGQLINNLAMAMSNVINYTMDTCLNQTIDMSVFYNTNASIGGCNSIYGGFNNYTSVPGNVYGM